MTNPIWRIIVVRTAQASLLAWLGHSLLGWPWTGSRALGRTLTPLLCAYFVFVFVGSWTWGLPIVSRLRGRERTIALTFDDGPDPVVTARILDALAQANAAATFFVLGSQISGNEPLLRRMANDGHTIGLHGQTHVPMVLPSWKQILTMLTRAKASLARACPGVPIAWLRPPHGFKTLTLPFLARRAGLRLCAWSVNSRDYHLTEPHEIARRVLRQARPGAVVLLHDGPPNTATADALPLILEGLTQKGYRCVALSPNGSML